MATCKDCIHYEVCATKDEKVSLSTRVKELVADDFTCFKNKADFVEVVHCRDCKYFYCFSAIDRQFYCKHHPKGLDGINVVEENPFCSYGERKKNDKE